MRVLKSTAPALVALAFCLGPSAAVPADPIVPKFDCMSMGCPATVLCDGSVCVVTDCGKGSCPACPSELKNLVIKGWCRYSCMKGSVQTGSALMLLTTPFDVKVGPICP